MNTDPLPLDLPPALEFPDQLPLSEELPVELNSHADDINASDPHFASLLPAGTTLRSALDEGRLDSPTLDDVVLLARRLLNSTAEAVMESLVIEAFRSTTKSKKQPSSEWVAGLTARIGVYGDPVTLQEAGNLVGVSRERMRQVESKIVERLRGAWVPQLRPILMRLVEESPVQDPVGVVLSQYSLSEHGLRAASVLNFVRLLGIDLTEWTGTTLRVADGWLVDSREETVLGAMRVASRHTSTYGMTTLEEVRLELSSEGDVADTADVRRVLEAAPSVGWAGEWLWVEKDVDNTRANSMINTVRSMLSVNSPLSVASLQEGVRRVWTFRKREIVPSVAAMETFFAKSALFMLEDGKVSHVTPLDYHEYQGKAAATMIDVLKDSPYQVMDRASLSEACNAAGLSHATVTVWTTYSEWMEKFGLNVWGLRGSNPNPAVVDEVRLAAKARHGSEAHATSWSWSPAGDILLTMDVSTSSRNSGTYQFDESLRMQIGGRGFKMIHDGEEVGVLRTSADHSWTWGWGKVFKSTGAKVGDVIQATIDLGAETATVVVGGRELWT